MSQSTKSKAYMVHPISEYCSPVWDPHLFKDSNKNSTLPEPNDQPINTTPLHLIIPITNCDYYKYT